MSNEHPKEKDFTLLIQVQQSDIDELAHVNNVAYVRWIQDVAAAHWNSVASADEKQKYMWVVIRHEIDYLSPAFSNDLVLATTWVGQSIGPRSDRFVLLTNKATGKLLAKAKTTWCLLDGATKRPKRIDEGVITLLTQVKI
jgi:acyl-CoA thioester hydrolase